MHKITWACRICASEGLLAFTHVHCPNCGHARDWEPTSKVRVSAKHRFTGDNFTCCASGWSEHAQFCGICGEAFLLKLEAPLLSSPDQAAPADSVLAELGPTLEKLFGREQASDLPDMTFWDEPSDLGLLVKLSS